MFHIFKRTKGRRLVTVFPLLPPSLPPSVYSSFHSPLGVRCLCGTPTYQGRELDEEGREGWGEGGKEGDVHMYRIGEDGSNFMDSLRVSQTPQDTPLCVGVGCAPGQSG